MKLNFQDVYETLASTSDEQQLFNRIASYAARLGFDYCCYGIRAPLPVSNPAVSIFETYPNGWMERYHKQGYLNIDPTVRAGSQDPQLIIWPEPNGEVSSSLWADACDFGLRFGVAQSSWSTRGAFGLLTLSRRTRALATTEIELLRQPIHWLANLSHTMMTPYLLPKLTPKIDEALTAREREVLCWTGEGKTAYETGVILNISERTVNFHINNAMTKLSATNKVQAVVKATAMGLLNAA